MRGNPPRFILPKPDVIAYQEGESALSISQRHVVCSATIANALKRAGIETRTMSEAISLLPHDHLREGRDALIATGEMSIRQSAGQQGIPVSEWDGFKKDKWSRIRNSKAWRVWRKAVYLRDRYHCVRCGTTSRGATGNIHPHHIRPKAKYPHLMFDVSNGITLCGNCHYATFRREDDFIEEFDA